MDSLFKEELILLNICANSNVEAIEQISQRLYVNGYVDSQFNYEIQKRERIFPTGLPTAPFGTSIPHTDSEYVINNAIAIGVLKDPVEFQVMGSNKDFVPVKIIFIIAQKEEKMQIDYLKWLIGIIQDENLLKNLVTMNHPKEILRLLNIKQNSLEKN